MGFGCRERDDELIECLHLLQSIYGYTHWSALLLIHSRAHNGYLFSVVHRSLAAAGDSEQKAASVTDPLRCFHPLALFAGFVRHTALFDDSLLLDYLISDETCFLQYLCRYHLTHTYNTHIYTHTHIHNTHIHTYTIHTYTIHTYTHTQYTHTQYTHTHIHTYTIHTYTIHTYTIHTYIHIHNTHIHNTHIYTDTYMQSPDCLRTNACQMALLLGH